MSYDFEFPDCHACGRVDCSGECICDWCGDGPNAHDLECSAIAKDDRFGRRECMSRLSPLSRQP